MYAALNSSVLAQVILAIEQATPVRDVSITLTTQLSGELALGGFRRLKLALYLEEVFDIELSDEAVERFVSVADIVNYLNRHDFEDHDSSGAENVLR